MCGAARLTEKREGTYVTTKARALLLNMRRSSYTAGRTPEWPERRVPMVKFLEGIEGGPPSVILAQECTKEQQLFISDKLGYEAFGNGVLPRTELDRDREGDNVVVFYHPHDWERVEQRIYWAGIVDKVGRTYIRAAKLKRKSTGASMWFATCHPPPAAKLKPVRMTHVRTLAKFLHAGGVDMGKLLWSSDWNDSAMYPASGVRTMLRKDYGLVDARDVLSADEFVGNSTNTAHGFKPTAHDGKHIDAHLAGKHVRFRYAKVLRTDDIRPVMPTDHNGILAGIEF